MWAVEKGFEVVAYRSLDFGVNLEDFDNDGWTAIMYGARRGNLALVRKLLQNGANLEVSSNEDLYTPLHLAAGNELMDICDILLSGGADPLAKDSDGKIPASYIKTPKNLERYNACVEQVAESGKSAEEINKTRVTGGVEMSLSRAMDIINRSAKKTVEKMKVEHAEATEAALAAAKAAALAAKTASAKSPPVDYGPSNYPHPGDVHSEGSAHFSAPSHGPSASVVSWLPHIFATDDAAAAAEQPGSRNRSIPGPMAEDADFGSSKISGLNPKASDKKTANVLSLDDLAKKGIELKEYARDLKPENVDSQLYKDRTFAFKKK